ncbi:hypothetical protein ACIQCD_17445 [Streptomyces sp. NPDC093250]|uniref:hypothetical protein n=1 Tax=Streptomyces sp. NPDC093250 TaxID=3366036 RepID=UPI00380851EA
MFLGLSGLRRDRLPGQCREVHLLGLRQAPLRASSNSAAISFSASRLAASRSSRTSGRGSASPTSRLLR